MAAARVIIDSRVKPTQKPRTLEGRVITLERTTEQHGRLLTEQERGLAQHGKQIGDLTIAQQRIDSALLALGARMSEFGVIHGRQLDAIHDQLAGIAEQLVALGAAQAKCAMACEAHTLADARRERAERDASL